MQAYTHIYIDINICSAHIYLIHHNLHYNYHYRCNCTHTHTRTKRSNLIAFKHINMLNHLVRFRSPPPSLKFVVVFAVSSFTLSYTHVSSSPDFLTKTTTIRNKNKKKREWERAECWKKEIKKILHFTVDANRAKSLLHI